MHPEDGKHKLSAVLIQAPGAVEFYDDLLTRRHYTKIGQCNLNTIVLCDPPLKREYSAHYMNGSIGPSLIKYTT